MATTHPLHASHPRRFARNRFVYPVLSRRSGGVSVGVNLNPDKRCNFRCVYCQVDRSSSSETRFVETDALHHELRETIPLVTTGQLFQSPPFDGAPRDRRRLCDIAFSGDGEPTTHKNLEEVVRLVADIKQELAEQARLVLITNASLLHRPHVQRVLKRLDDNRGEVWAKLDAGTEGYFQQIARTTIPFQQILDNLALAARDRPIVIQTMFLRLEGPPTPAEVDAYCGRLTDLLAGGGWIDRVQLYTVARAPAESAVSALTNEEVDAIAERVRRVTGLRIDPFYA